jgi:hypothetical protein
MLPWERVRRGLPLMVTSSWWTPKPIDNMLRVSLQFGHTSRFFTNRQLAQRQNEARATRLYSRLLADMMDARSCRVSESRKGHLA